MHIKLKSLLCELIYQDLSTSSSPYIVAWKDKLFIYDSDTKDISPIINHLKQHPYAVKYPRALNDADDLNNYFYELEDAVSGQWDRENSNLYLQQHEINPTTSPLLRKVVRQLKIKSVSRLDPETDKNITTNTRKVKGVIPDFLYHGSTTLNIDNILNNGVRPPDETGTKTNWKTIIHSDIIFLTASKRDAFFYAYNAARQTTHGYPMVLQVRVPDRALIIPDFDADPERKTQQYHSYKPLGTAYSMRPSTMSMHTGKFGYQGHILPQHIEWIYFAIGDKGESIKKVRPSTLKSIIDNIGIDDFAERIGAHRPERKQQYRFGI